MHIIHHIIVGMHYYDSERVVVGGRKMTDEGHLTILSSSETQSSLQQKRLV